MKKLALISFCFISYVINAQSYLDFNINSGLFTASSFNTTYVIHQCYTANRYFYPFNVGVNVNYHFNEKNSISTAYNFYYRYQDISLYPFQNQSLYITDFPAIFAGNRLVINSIPLIYSREFKFKSLEDISLEITSGVSTSFYSGDSFQYGQYKTHQISIITFTFGYFYSLHVPFYFDWAYEGGVGLINDFKKIGRLKTSVNLHFPFKKSIGHELYYYFTDNVNPAKTETHLFKERDAWINFRLSWYLPIKIYFHKSN